MNNTKIKVNDDPLQTVLSPLGSFREVCFLANYFYSLMWFSLLQQANATKPKARGVGGLLMSSRITSVDGLQQCENSSGLLNWKSCVLF